MNGPWLVTAVGLITPAGDTSEDLFATLDRRVPLAAKNDGFQPASEGLEGLEEIPAVAIHRFDPKTYLKRKGLKDLSRTSQLGCAAASRFSDGLGSLPGEAIGVAFGSAWAGMTTVVEFERAAHKDGPRLVDPLLFTETVANVPAGQISIFFGWSAFNGTLSAGSASGLETIRWAIDLLEEERAAVAVAGGADELNPPLLRALRARREIAASLPSLPLSAGRSGVVPGEGACLLLIESEEHAWQRGAKPLGRIAAGAGAFAPVRKDGSSARSAATGALIGEVLEAAGVRASEIDLLVLSAHGDVIRDRDEARAVIEFFGEGELAPPAVAPKAIVGELWAAAGPVGVVAALQALQVGAVPGRPVGWVADPELSGLHLPARGLRRPLSRALVLDGSAGGHLSALVVTSPSGGDRP